MSGEREEYTIRLETVTSRACHYLLPKMISLTLVFPPVRYFFLVATQDAHTNATSRLPCRPLNPESMGGETVFPRWDLSYYALRNFVLRLCKDAIHPDALRSVLSRFISMWFFGSRFCGRDVCRLGRVAYCVRIKRGRGRN